MNAGGIAVAGAAETVDDQSPGPELFAFTVTVYSNSGGNVGAGSTVHLEPRQSGLPYTYNATTNSNGVASFSIQDQHSGYYDLEASQDGYEDGANLQEWVGSGGSKSVYLDPI